MVSFSDDALVLVTHPYRDRHLIVTLLTPKRGIIRGVLRNARAGKAPPAAAAQTLSLVQVSGHQRPNAELATFHRIHLLRSSYPLSAGLARSAAAAVVAELLDTFCAAGEESERQFRLGRSLLDALLAGTDPATVVSYAQLWTLLLGGVLPPLGTCTECGRALGSDIRLRGSDGQAVCEKCAAGATEAVSADGLRLLAEIRGLPAAEVATTVPGEIARWLDRRVRAEAERPLRALEFFRRHPE